MRELASANLWQSNGRGRVPANVAERFAAALLIPGVLREDGYVTQRFQLGQVLEHEVCSNLSVLAPELTVCMEAAERLSDAEQSGSCCAGARGHCRAKASTSCTRSQRCTEARIPHLLLPFQRDRFASNTFMVPCLRKRKTRLCQAGFRETSRSPTVLVDIQTGRSIRLYEDRT